MFLFKIYIESSSYIMLSTPLGNDQNWTLFSALRRTALRMQKEGLAGVRKKREGTAQRSLLPQNCLRYADWGLFAYYKLVTVWQDQ